MAFGVKTIAKYAISSVVGVGTGKIVQGVIANNVTIEKKWDVIAIKAATWVLSGIVTTAAKKYTDETFDEIYDGVSETVQTFKTQKKLDRINKHETTFETEGLDKENFEYRDDKWYIKTKDDATS